MNDSEYRYGFRENVEVILVSILAALLIAWLFYQSWFGMVFWAPLYLGIRREYKKKRSLQQKDRLLREFGDGIQAVSTALLAGYSMENAWREAEREIGELHGKESVFYAELCRMNTEVRMNQSLEKVLLEFAGRSGCEEIESFAEVFSFAKRSGGDFAGMIQTTVWKLIGKMEVEREIATVLAGKKLEGRIMNLMPILILAYLNLCSRDFLQILYGNAFGAAVMSVALGIYVAAIKVIGAYSGYSDIKEKYLKQYKKVIAVLIAAVVLALAVWISEKQNPSISMGNYLKRNENGEGSYEEELQLTVEGLLDSYRYNVRVPEQKLTEAQERQYLEDAWTEIQAEFPGRNEGPDCIRERVEIHNTYQGGRVEAEWNFDDYKIMDMDGNVIAEELPEEGELVGAGVELSCGDSAICKEFYFQVFPAELTEQEKILKYVQEKLLEQEQNRGTDQLRLPGEMGEYKLIWQEGKTYLPIKIFLLGIMIAGMIPAVERSRKREMQKKRAGELMMEYPDMVSKLSILLSAGMTLQKAWKKIAFSYEQKREKNEVKRMPVYEEMLVACHELESGRGEESAYERFGERCGLAVYRKLGNILAQNLRKGNRGIIELLEKEAENSFEERKQTAKRYGEEAATKLLFPMMLMFGMILVILIVPAIAAFRM